MSGVRLVSTLAVMGAVQELIARYKAAGSPITADFAPTVALLDRLRAGEAADIAILTAQGIDDLTAETKVQAGSRTDIALSHVGVAVKAGTPKPDIGTLAAFRATLLGCRSIAYSRI